MGPVDPQTGAFVAPDDHYEAGRQAVRAAKDAADRARAEYATVSVWLMVAALTC